MTARKRRSAKTDDLANEFFLDTPDELAEDEGAEEAETAARSRAIVQPIRDEPDELVFRFEVGPAILAQLLEKLERLPIRPLSSALTARYPGFYQLFVAGEPTYIGKTARPIGQRMREHVKKMRYRLGLDAATIECRYVFVEDPSLVDLAEGALIDFFGARGLAEWNTTGFGSKVTGHRRGLQEASDWALKYPADLNAAMLIELPPQTSLLSLVKAIASTSPITVSIPQRHRKSFRDAHSVEVTVGSISKTFLQWMGLVESHLQPGWHINKQAESWYIEPGS